MPENHDSGHEGPLFPKPLIPPTTGKWRWFWVAGGVLVLIAIALVIYQHVS